MIPQLLNSTSIPLLEKLAVFTERRQNVLAGNIANLDTNDYRMQDLSTADFQQAMKAAIARRKAPSYMSPLNSNGFSSLGNSQQAGKHSQPFPLPSLSHPPIPATTQSIDDLFGPELFQAKEADPENVIFRDGSNRSVETEMMKMTKNKMTHQFAIELMNIQMRMLETVVRERI